MKSNLQILAWMLGFWIIITHLSLTITGIGWELYLSALIPLVYQTGHLFAGA